MALLKHANRAAHLTAGIVLFWFALGAAHYLVVHVPLWMQVYGELPGALGRLNLRFPDGFFPALGFALLSMALHAALGIAFLRLFARLPRWTEALAGLFAGIGLANFVLEWFAIAFWLNRWTVAGTFALLFAGIGLARRRMGAGEIDFAAEPALWNSAGERAMYYAAFSALAAITLLNFWHSLLYPVNYWDSLIYYIHYGELTWMEGGFPVMVCLQVGLGLGANYPHLYPLNQAVTAVLAGQWSDLYGQLLCPAAGVAACAAVYHLALRLYGNRLTAILAALSFRIVPYVTSYLVWASDYALITACAVLMALFLAVYFERPSVRSLQPALLLAAAFPHINYLGWLMWLGPFMAVGLAWRACVPNRRALAALAAAFAVWMALAATWNVRNWIVTGNPVYAFFPEVFGGENIDLEVLRSSENEWRAHGFGADHIPGGSPFARIVNTPWFFVQDWRFAPITMGLMAPALLLGWRRRQPLFVCAAALIAAHLAYQYFISGFYWYHIIAVFPLSALFVARFLNETPGRRWRMAFGAVLLAASVSPGISYSLMGPKRDASSPQLLQMIPHPGLPPESFYRLAFPGYAGAWRWLNGNAEPGAGILSHENRYHVFRDDLRVIHLDDCGLSPLYGAPYPEIHSVLLERGVRYYLYIEDEETHPVTERLGHRAFLRDPDYFTLIQTEPKAAVYRLEAGAPDP